MSKAQKRIIAITLFIVVLILLFPTTYYYSGRQRRYAEREFVFTKGGGRTIDTQETIYESLAVVLIGGIVVILLSLKKEK